MLKENKHVSQIPGEDRRRWFSDRQFDLVVWETPQRSIAAFQLCYDLQEKQKVIAWSGRPDLSHALVDDSEQSSIRNRTPILIPAGPLDYHRVVPEFFEHAKSIDLNIARFVLEKLLGQRECTVKKEQFVYPHSAIRQGDIAAHSNGKSGVESAALIQKPKLFEKISRRRNADEQAPPRRVMLPDELLQKVKKIEITTRRIVRDMMGGQYKSRFKGHGMQFSEHRVYVAGDDIRHIDWKVSARTREPLIKKFEEERELTVLLLVDVSSSEHFSSGTKLKNEISAEVGGMLAYAACQAGDRVGVILFADQVEKLIVPKRGKSHVLRIIHDLLSYVPKTTGTNLGLALESARRVLKHSSVVFVISDFIDQDYEIALRRLSKEHDVVAIWIQDPKEKEIPNIGSMVMVDPESGQRVLVELGSYGFKKWFQEFRKNYQGQTKQNFSSSRVQVLPISTDEDYGNAIVKFFQTRGLRAK